MQDSHKYDDIIHLPRPASPRRAKMSMVDRGAQFSPFAALVGYDAAIQETARRTGCRVELTDGEKLRLNEAIQEITDRLPTQPEIRITWFVPDLRKDGGEYVTEECRVKKIDPYGRGLALSDGRRIAFEDIIALEQI